jgi:two-component system response regulator MprA
MIALALPDGIAAGRDILRVRNNSRGSDVANVLVVDDDRAVREALDRALRVNGHVVTMAPDGLTAINLVQRSRPDLIVLDVNLPDVDGFGVTRRLRSDGDRTPVLLLTARVEVGDRVAGLDAGADDYLTKPFALDELLARVRALLRRSEPADPDAGPRVLRCGDLSLDIDAMEGRRGDRAVELTRTEFQLLELLLENHGRVLERDVIHDRVWGFDGATSSNSLEVYIGYLRRKLEAEDESRLIHTVRGVGYVLREQT